MVNGLKRGGFLAIFLVIVSLVFFVGAQNTEYISSDSEPYYVYSSGILIKGFLDIRHDFGNVFSADLSKGQLKAIQILGIKTEPVSIFMIIEGEPCRNDKDCPEGEYCDKTTTVRGMGVCVLKDGDGEEPAPEPEPTRNCYPSEQKPWGITRVNGGDGGDGIKVAVLDTGVMQSHLDLKNRIIYCGSTVTRFPPDRKDCEDGHGHGTHVSGTILADAGSDLKGIYGVAPGASLMAIKVCDRQGRCYGDDIAAGINSAVDKGANIISMSLGGSSISSVEKNAIDNAVANGVLVIAAAGNSGPNLDTINYPAAYFRVVSVAAVDINDRVADFSSRGIGATEFKYEERYLEVSGPGVSIYSTWNDGCYRTASGTSMATPHVSGLAAKLWTGNADTTRSSLHERSVDITQGLHATGGYDPASGFGLVVA